MAKAMGDILGALLDRLELTPATKAAMVVLRWPEFVGPVIAAHARPEGVKRGVLTVAVESSVWATELSLHVPLLLERINGALGEGVVTDVRFVVGARRRGPSQAEGGPAGRSRQAGAGHSRPDAGGRAGQGIPPGPSWVYPWPDKNDLLHVPLTSEEQERVAALAAAVRDPDLATATARWLALTLKARRWLSREAGAHRQETGGDSRAAGKGQPPDRTGDRRPDRRPDGM